MGGKSPERKSLWLRTRAGISLPNASRTSLTGQKRRTCRGFYVTILGHHVKHGIKYCCTCHVIVPSL